MAAIELKLVSAPMVAAAPIPTTAIPTTASSIVKPAKAPRERLWHLWNVIFLLRAVDVPKLSFSSAVSRAFQRPQLELPQPVATAGFKRGAEPPAIPKLAPTTGAVSR